MGGVSRVWQWGVVAVIGAALAGLLLLLALNTSAEVALGPVFGRHTERVSVSTSGRQADGWSEFVSVSDNGRWVAFDSMATTLERPDANGDFEDVFVHDLVTGRTERVSLSTTGVQGNAESRDPDISADGRFVAFDSHARNLERPDTYGACDVWVRDRLRDVTERMNVIHGAETRRSCSYEPAISADGRYVAFTSDSRDLVEPATVPGRSHVYVRDRLLGVTELVSVATDGERGNRSSGFPAISANGRFVAFHSRARNLVPGDTNGTSDIFVHDRATGRTEMVSISSDGRQADRSSLWPVISGHGNLVAFSSGASTLVPGDDNHAGDVFVYNRATDRIRRISVGLDGEESRYDSVVGDNSADGRFVAFSTPSGKLVRGDTNAHEDVFVYSMRTGRTKMVSVGRHGLPGNVLSLGGALSAHGNVIAFESHARNLVRGDTNAEWDIFVRTR